MDAQELRDDVRAGRVSADRLVDLIVALQRELQVAQERIAELERKLAESPRPRVDEPYSVRSEEQRQKDKGKKPRKRNKPARKGRITTTQKVAQAERTEPVFPKDVPEHECRYSHTRPVWRLENGRAILVAYEVYRGPGNRYGTIPGVLGRSEFGIEIVIAIAFQVFVVGLSFDKVCLLLNFFQNLKLRKSQLDALLNQLARAWEHEFETLCTLLAHSAVVHADETSWSINSVWAFLSEQVRVLLFGVPKDAATLQAILDPATFGGIVISDDAAVYANFTHSQKCWAHLLRKAIKLTLQDPDNAEYRDLTDRLLAIYREACRVQRDRRLGEAGRARKVAVLDDAILELCGPVWFADLPPLEEGPANDYRLLCNELMKLMLAEQLFVFVTAAAVQTPSGETLPVSGTNNEAERTLRGPAQARDTGRTSKTVRGARRRTVILSVLESLRQHLVSLTLPSIIAEVQRWMETGRSCFADLLSARGVPPPEKSILNKLLPLPAD